MDSENVISDTETRLQKLRYMILEAGVKKKDVAARLGMKPPAFSLLLSGHRRPPKLFTFLEECEKAIAVCQEANRAAEEAKEAVIKGDR